MPGRAYGYRLSPPDGRDKLADTTGLQPLDEVDLRTGPMPLVFDQGSLGSCTANAVCAALQFDLSLDRIALGEGRAHRRSRLDLYYGERSLEGSLGEGDTGAIGRDGFKFAQQTGVLLEEAWPYSDDSTSYEGPPPTGKRHKLAKPYANVAQDQDTIKQVLSNQQTVAFGFTAYTSFESQTTEQTGIVRMPGAGDYPIGGHEMLVVGYLAASPGYALVRNSWGSGWGKGGYCMFPWSYLCNATLASDLRTIVRAT